MKDSLRKNKVILDLQKQLDHKDQIIKNLESKEFLKHSIFELLEQLKKKDKLLDNYEKLLEKCKIHSVENKIIISSQHKEILELNKQIRQLQLYNNEHLLQNQINAIKEENFALYKKIHILEEKIKN